MRRIDSGYLITTSCLCMQLYHRMHTESLHTIEKKLQTGHPLHVTDGLSVKECFYFSISFGTQLFTKSFPNNVNSNR